MLRISLDSWDKDILLQVVYNPEDAEVFLPRLLPVLDTASQSVSDPEVGPGALPLMAQNLCSHKHLLTEHCRASDASLTPKPGL